MQTPSRIGDLVVFNYVGDYSTDPYPEVIVLHNGYFRRMPDGRLQKYVHGLAWKVLTDQEKQYIRAVLNPTFAQQISQNNPVLKQQLAARGVLSAIHGENMDFISNPKHFYERFLRHWITTKDSYRLYKPEGISGIRVLTKREALMGKEKDTVFSKYINKFKNLVGP